jgi:hypothetical protein
MRSSTGRGPDREQVTARMQPRTLAAAVLGAVVLLAVLVLAGRWEGSRHERAEIAAMRRTFQRVGPLDNPSLEAYRIDVDFEFDCLLYRRGSNPYALELCFDRSGRLAEAIDRRSGKARIASLREHPQASTIRVKRAQVVRLLKRLGAPRPRSGWH